MVVTTAIVLLPLCSAFSAQAGQGAQQDISLEGRIAQLQQEIEQKPRDPNLHFELSKLYEEDVERYYDEALSEFEYAVDNGLKGKSYNILNRSVTRKNNKGVKLFERGKYDEAIKVFKSALEKDLNNPNTYNNLGCAYSAKEQYDKAIEYMKITIDLNPASVMFNQTIGNTCVKKGDFELALLTYKKIEFIDPEYNEHYYGMARAYHGLEQFDKAINALDKLPRQYREHETVKTFRKECVRLLKQSR